MSWFRRRKNVPEHFEPLVACGPLADEVTEAVPELAGPLESFLSEWGDEPPEPGLVNLADSVLFPFVEKMLRSGDSRDLLKRLFEVLERMATHPDPHVRDALQVGVVNPLVDRPDLFELARPLMGPRTLGMTQPSG